MASKLLLSQAHSAVVCTAFLCMAWFLSVTMSSSSFLKVVLYHKKAWHILPKNLPGLILPAVFLIFSGLWWTVTFTTARWNCIPTQPSAHQDIPTDPSCLPGPLLFTTEAGGWWVTTRHEKSNRPGVFYVTTSVLYLWLLCIVISYWWVWRPVQLPTSSLLVELGTGQHCSSGTI